MARIISVRIVAILAGLLVISALALITTRYQRDLGQARERVSSGSQVI